jgi:hypothetical protein
MKVLPFVLSAVVSGCVFVSSDSEPRGAGGSGGGTPQPIGPVAHDADEAWPKRPANVPIITPEQIASACAELAACDELDPSSGMDRLAVVAFCVSQLTWSAERAIPVSGLLRWNERAEYYVLCQLEHAGDCAAQKSCSSGRDARIYCEEDGCRLLTGLGYDVSCAGSVAQLASGANVTERDCARAYAECDPSSPTGCTDRPFTACPSEGNKADRCDGDVRLGCDGAGQVSYRDCSRMGGSCGTTADGRQDCIYQSVPDTGCTDPALPSPSCSGSTLGVCVNGKRVSLSAPGVCG